MSLLSVCNDHLNFYIEIAFHFVLLILFGSFSKHIGRRKFLILSGLGMTFTTLVAVFFMYVQHTTASIAAGGDTILLICVLGYVCCSSLGVLVIVSLFICYKLKFLIQMNALGMNLDFLYH